jgi:phospholipid/cholesterol/gamma-HCH transport system substrate-binding protein
MTTRLIRVQLIVFALVATIAIGWTLVRYARVPELLGFGQYRITIHFSDAAGLYPNAVVTYRGVDVGRVRSIEIEPRGIDAQLRIDEDIDIPAHSIARIGSRSAIGEQYVDIVPRAVPGPNLADGQTIDEADTRLPVSTGDVVGNLDSLLSSTPRASLTTVLNELYQGFHGRGDDLGQLIGSSDSLLRAANTAVVPTKRLLEDLQPVLDTQRQLAPTTRALLGNLAAFSSTVRAQDSTLRSILDRGPRFAAGTRSLVSDLAPTLPPLLDNLTAVGQVSKLYLPSIEQILVIYPAFTAGLQTALLNGPGDTVQLSARTNIDDPPPCTVGYPGTQRDPRQTDPAPVTGSLYCRAPANSPLAVRGARNTPCPQDPTRRSATPQGCGLKFPDPDGEADANDRDTEQPAPYDPTSGMIALPGGQSFLLEGTQNVESGSGQPSWLSLLLPHPPDLGAPK